MRAGVGPPGRAIYPGQPAAEIFTREPRSKSPSVTTRREGAEDEPWAQTQADITTSLRESKYPISRQRPRTAVSPRLYSSIAVVVVCDRGPSERPNSQRGQRCVLGKTDNQRTKRLGPLFLRSSAEKSAASGFKTNGIGVPQHQHDRVFERLHGFCKSAPASGFISSATVSSA